MVRSGEFVDRVHFDSSSILNPGGGGFHLSAYAMAAVADNRAAVSWIRARAPGAQCGCLVCMRIPGMEPCTLSSERKQLERCIMGDRCSDGISHSIETGAWQPGFVDGM